MALLDLDFDFSNEDGALHNPLIQKSHLARVDLVPTRALLLQLNGETENKKWDMRKIVGLDTSSALHLQAPFGQLRPAISYAGGSGRIFGQDYRWRFRYSRSSTGEASGMSEIPSVGVNMGREAPAGSTNVVGQKAIFNFVPDDFNTGVNANIGGGATTLQIFRNTSNQLDVWYLVGELSLPAAGEFTFEDNTPDEELIANEQASLRPNPQYALGIMPPMARAYQHPTGRTLYYGIRRMGPYEGTSATLTTGERDVDASLRTTENGMRRIGQRFVPLETSGGTYTDDTIYRICAYDRDGAGAGIAVNPPVVASDDMTDDVATLTKWEVRDDRDGRLFYMSEPGAPGQIDFAKAVSPGTDADDGVLFIGGFRGQTVLFTRRRIYLVLDDFSEDPSLTMRFSIAAEEGTYGLWTTTVTEEGFVFVNERGVRVFDLASPPRALGGEQFYSQFPALSQFRGVESSLLAESFVCYDATTHRSYWSYAPAGRQAPEETLVFDHETRQWRGPWRRQVYSFGTVRSSAGEDVPMFGDLFGNLIQDETAVSDVVNATTHTTSGTITSVQDGNGLVFTDSTATLDPESDKRLVGCPIVLNDGNGSVYQNWIADVPSGTQIMLAHFPEGALSTGWTYTIGSIDWKLTTAPFDANEPIQHKTLVKLRTRFERGDAGTFTIETSTDGDTDIEAKTQPVDISTSKSEVHDASPVNAGGRMFSVSLSGTSTNGHPKITNAIADLEVGRSR